ncbi:MAG: ABC transporter permease [Candidatus Dormibacteraeota bacterium]|nr:ABC transporter permease [Candidatus Dormibacteraeota bacterium]
MAATGVRPVAALPGVIWAQVRGNLLGFRRQPAFVVFSLVLPLMFYAFFGGIFGGSKVGSTTIYTFLLASYGSYAMGSIMVFNIGINMAQQRARKLDLLQRATPLPGWVAILAQVVSAVALGCLTLLVLFVYAYIVGKVRLDVGHAALLLLALIFGALPLLGLGLAIGYGATASSAPALANLIYLPMSFLSGIFLPLSLLPGWIRNIAQVVPTYHYAQLAWSTVGAGDEAIWKSILWLAGWALVLFLIAARVYRREARLKFS